MEPIEQSLIPTPSPELNPLRLSLSYPEMDSPHPHLALDLNHDLPLEELRDHACDPKNPVTVEYESIVEARGKIKSGIVETPLWKSRLSRYTEVNLFLKLELFQYTGCFKERGSRNLLMTLSKDQKKRGVVTASAGNHGLSVAYHGRSLGIPVTVVLPLSSPIIKRERCERLGANILLWGNDLGESKQRAMSIAKLNDLYFVNGYDNPHVIAGQGSVGLEILEQMAKQSKIDAVVVQVGGGSLIAGISTVIKKYDKSIKIIAVETEKSVTMNQSLKKGRPICVKVTPSMADGLAVPMIGVNSFATAKDKIDKSIVIDENLLSLSLLRLVEEDKLVTEGAGAAGVAALLGGKLPELKGKNVVCIITGGNIDTTMFGRSLDRGLVADGRLVRFHVTIQDKTEALAELCTLIAQKGACVKDLTFERPWTKGDIFASKCQVCAEIQNHEHAASLEAALKKKYENVQF